MRQTQLLLMIAVAVVLAFSGVSANGNGAIVIRDYTYDEYWLMPEWNGEEGEGSIISIFAARSDFFCSDEGDEAWYWYQIVATPFGIAHWSSRDWGFVRVWYMDHVICEVPPSADGIVNGRWNTNGWDIATGTVAEPLRGAFVHTHTIHGMINDRTGACASGATFYQSVQGLKVLPNSGWPDCEDCFQERRLHGPSLTCQD
jgi:hypothetical protein